MRRRVPRGWAALIAVALGGCGEDEPSPVDTVRKFASEARRSDTEDLIPLLERRVQSHLQAAAERASDQVGGRRNIEPEEVLQILDVDRRFQVDELELLEQTEKTARVQIRTTAGGEQVFDLVHQDGSWRIRVPLPTTAAKDPES